MEHQKSTSSEDSTLGAKSDSSQDMGSIRAVKMMHKKNVHLADSWSWNDDFTTRYNQDMQREKEEKLMMDLELLLSQNLSLDGSSSGPSKGSEYYVQSHIRSSAYGFNKV